MSGPDLAPNPSLRLWLLAAAGAVTIHVAGAALALAYLSSEEPPDDLGAPAIEIGLELVAPRAEPVDLPVGPPTDASASSPPVVEQKTEVKPSDLPTDVPTETEDPDRVVTTRESQKPKAEEQEVTPTQTAPSAETAATVATAPPSSETLRESPQSVAPIQGSGESEHRARLTWQRELAVHLDRNKRYPSDRTQRAAQVVIVFVLDRTGHVLSARVAQSSGDTSFDNAALAMMRRADPVPPPPALISDEGLRFSLPVNFTPPRSK
jgi:TonB family protein